MSGINTSPMTRPLGRVGAFAPGNYLCKCAECGEPFGGDKRAFNCLNCAIDELAKRASELHDEPTEFIWGRCDIPDTVE